MIGTGRECMGGEGRGMKEKERGGKEINGRQRMHEKRKKGDDKEKKEAVQVKENEGKEMGTDMM